MNNAWPIDSSTFAGQVDERTLVMLYLLIEQLRGSDSQLGPWLKMLPLHCETPLVYGQGQLQELKGTTLHRATQSSTPVPAELLLDEVQVLGPCLWLYTLLMWISYRKDANLSGHVHAQHYCWKCRLFVLSFLC